jgi:uncharacterized protein (DUF1684 family)
MKVPFRVMCINNKPIRKIGTYYGIAPELKESEEYEVESVVPDGGYKLVGITHNRSIWGSYKAERFVILPEPDADEMMHQVRESIVNIETAEVCG